MISGARKWVFLTLLAGGAVTAVICASRYRDRLPYHDQFASNSANEWRPFGGVWRLKDGMVLNLSDERGAKVVSGSPVWRDYQMTADMKMLGHGGDIGVLLRVAQAEKGINSYRGFYLGMRSRDNALIAGVGDYDWIETEPAAMPGGVHTNSWYRIHVVVVDCEVTGQLTNLQTGQSTWSGLHQPNCSRIGRIGLRSLATGAAWRNVHVEEATRADLEPMLAHLPPLSAPQFPSREDEYSHMRQHYEQLQAKGNVDVPNVGGAKLLTRQALLFPVRTIRELSNTHSEPVSATLRGVVTLTDPLYIQDSTGGVAVHLLTPAPLNVGDDIEISGETAVHGPSIVFEASSERLLWDRTPFLPVSITSTQAASGAFEGSLIELNGEVVSRTIAPDGTVPLDLTDIAQRFRVAIPHELSSQPNRDWSVGSLLRVRGICSDMANAASSGDAFTIFPRSASDVEVISGPPWNRGSRLFALILTGVIVLLVCIYMYVKLERWRMRTIMQERERLAMELHDTLAQSFAGVGFHLQSMRKGMREYGKLPEGLMRKLDTACEMTSQTHREASARIVALHPSAETECDLLTLLQRSMTAMLNGSHLPVVLERRGHPYKVSLFVRDTLLRIGAEAIANVLRHSRATRLVLSLTYQEDSVQLAVIDNGTGFDPEQRRSSFGMQSMAARAEEIGGSLEVHSAPGEGSVITISAPRGQGFSALDWMRFQWQNLRAGAAQSSSKRTSP